MAKTTKDSEKTFEKNLEYIGLNLNKLPSFFKKYEDLNFRITKSYDDNTYKVYKYVNIKDIQILITPSDRITELKERYKLASPVYEYLEQKKEENIEKFASFIKLVSTLNKDRINEITKEQEELNERIPYEVKYPDNFIWQLYYSEHSKKYFMLVPLNEQDNNAFFYLLKEQIANIRSRKGKFIFAPISHLEYSGEFLTKSEIEDIENYLWYFTNEWPNVYEIYDKSGEMFIKIVGETNVYEKIKTPYAISIDTKEKAVEFYKVLKAMFILATGAKEEYKFTTRINKQGEIEFWHEDTKIQYSTLSDYIKLQYLSKIDELKYEQKENVELHRKIEKFKIVIEDLNAEYLLRQKQIAIFLECKRTFFGKVKYFFKKKKEKNEVTQKEVVKSVKKEERQEVKKDETLEELYKLKQQYTIEDLISICTKLEEIVKENTNMNLDLKAAEAKQEILTKKIDNADLYLKEIDKHKKSIFEFWKFTSKDETQTLGEGEEPEEQQKTKMSKTFDYEADIEDMGKYVDEMQRRKFSKSETDAIFAIMQVPESFKEINNEKETDVEVFVEKQEEEVRKGRSRGRKNNDLEKDLSKLKKEYEKDIKIIKSKDFDIFGGLVEDKTKIKTINNIKHREIEKNKFKVLNINKETDIKEYSETIENFMKLLNESFNKIKSPYDMSLYCLTSKKNIEGINLFDINPKKVIKEGIDAKKSKITLIKINIKEKMPVIFYSNIIFYDNIYKTLPAGMNLSTKALFDVSKLKLNFKQENSFYINNELNEFEIDTKEIKIYEYDVEEIKE